MKNLTSLSHRGPWGLLDRRGTRLLCPDGKVRAPSRLALSADTFFSVPCGMRIAGRYVTGYATGESNSSGIPDGQSVMCFRPHTSQVTAGKCPAWPQMFSPEWDSLLAKAFAPD